MIVKKREGRQPQKSVKSIASDGAQRGRKREARKKRRGEKTKGNRTKNWEKMRRPAIGGKIKTRGEIRKGAKGSWQLCANMQLLAEDGGKGILDPNIKIHLQVGLGKSMSCETGDSIGGNFLGD